MECPMRYKYRKRWKRILLKLRESGCNLLFIGLESASEEGLVGIERNNWKYKQFKHYPEYIQRIQSNGLGVMGSFMVGLDTDDLTFPKKIGDFVEQNYLLNTNINIMTPMPGTRLRQRLIKKIAYSLCLGTILLDTMLRINLKKCQLMNLRKD